MYTVILGAANSGKTCLFLEQMTNKIIISVVDVEKIFDSIATMNKYSFDYINIRMKNNNMSQCIRELFARNGKLNILIDEIHFFTEKEHVELIEILDEIGRDLFNLYYAVIPSSFDQKYKIEDEESCLPNVVKVLSKANNIIVVTALCKTCKINKTVQSGIVNERHIDPVGRILVGKNFFFPQCVDCKSNI